MESQRWTESDGGVDDLSSSSTTKHWLLFKRIIVAIAKPFSREVFFLNIALSNIIHTY